MHKGVAIGLLLLLTLALVPSLALGSDAAVWFEQGLRQDSEGQARLAFAQYRRAAEAGLPQAEFNVAAMLDSGRGVDQDFAQAATWYARAAARGNARAAYNLGQMYANGQGVPRNVDLARAWFAASDLEAARSRIAALPIRSPGQIELSAPHPVTPSEREIVSPPPDGVELVWTSQPQPEVASYFVELAAIGPSGSREVFSTFESTTSTFASIHMGSGAYAWRVFTVTRKSRRYAVSPWINFTVQQN